MNDKIRLLLHQLEDRKQSKLFNDDEIQELINEIKDYLFIYDDNDDA